MNPVSRLAVPTVVAPAVAVVVALAATGPSQQSGQAAKAAASRPRTTYLYLPGFRELRTEDVQQELQLSDQQKNKLRAIGEKYYNQSRQDWAELRGMSAEERRKKYAEIREKNAKRIKQIRKQVEQLLSADQLQRLTQINLRTRVPTALANPRVLDRLRVTEEQKRRLRQILEQMQREMRRLQQKTLERTLEVLTPQQQQQLEELTTQGPAFYGAGRSETSGGG